MGATTLSSDAVLMGKHLPMGQTTQAAVVKLLASGAVPMDLPKPKARSLKAALIFHSTPEVKINNSLILGDVH